MRSSTDSALVEPFSRYLINGSIRFITGYNLNQVTWYHRFNQDGHDIQNSLNNVNKNMLTVKPIPLPSKKITYTHKKRKSRKKNIYEILTHKRMNGGPITYRHVKFFHLMANILHFYRFNLRTIHIIISNTKLPNI